MRYSGFFVWLLLAVGVTIAGGLVGEPRVQIDVLPRVMMANSTMRIRCRVARNAANRGLSMGLEGVRTSFVQLDGEGAKVFHEVYIEHVPCGDTEAFCAVTESTGRVFHDALPVEVRCIGGER